jgi:L-2-hydroxyglutarate oxidase LhgO
VISCAGLYSDKVAGMSGRPPVQIVPFRGDYYSLVPEARHLCRGLIYPVPDPTLPFLGVHFTKRADGAVWAGPNAVLATAREGYGRTDVNAKELLETLRFPGFRKLAKRYWKTGAHEAWRDVSKRAFVRELQRYVPSVQSEQLVFGPSGVRAQALQPDGAMVDDFRILADAESMHVLNAPSPAATASLAIAGHLSDEAATLLDLDVR